MRIFFLFGLLLSACACATTATPSLPAPAGFCETVHSLVRAPIDPIRGRNVHVESTYESLNPSRSPYRIVSADPQDEAAMIFLDSLNQLEPDTPAPVAAEIISGCLDTAAGFRRTKQNPIIAELLESALTYIDRVLDGREGRRILVHADSIGGASVTVFPPR